ncbi:MAG: Hsp70 family protein, partial [Fuerstiella sp.]|nr:Hsp70 family protein [Fuerstiella sp.]
MTEKNSLDAVGIDLGTTRSVVAHLDTTGRPLTIQNLEGDATTPSVVFFDRTSVVVGKEAVKVAEFEPDRVAYFAKRHLGKAAFSMNVAGQHLPPEIIQALVLQKLKADGQNRLGEFQKCVVTVPAYFNEPRRKATQDSGRLAGLDVTEIINEPTAAALAFGVQKGFVDTDGKTEQLETVLVYDLGGGTFDVTLMEIERNDYRAIGTAGDVYLGGIDWDQRIADHVAEQFQIQHGVDPRKDASHRLRLLAEAEDAKRSLSQRDETVIRFAMDGQRAEVLLNRAEFETLCGDLIDRTMFTTRRVLKEADRSFRDVSRLLLVGGSSRMPMVQNMLETESGLKVDRSLSADESVAHGAAIYAGILLNSDVPKKSRISVSNINSHDLGILGVDTTTGFPRRSMMIPRNSSLPKMRGKRFKTSRDNQESVSVNVVEGGDVQGRHSTEIGKCVVRDLPPDLPKATPVDVVFYYKQDGRLQILAQLPTIQRRAKLTIERGSGLSEEMLKWWKKRLDNGILNPPTEAPPTGMAAETMCEATDASSNEAVAASIVHSETVPLKSGPVVRKGAAAEKERATKTFEIPDFS